MSDFHHFKERLEKKIEKIKTCSDISEGNKKVMLKFADDCYANGLGRARICKLMYCLTMLSRLLGKYLNLSYQRITKVN
jgi:hypothetical protein